MVAVAEALFEGDTQLCVLFAQTLLGCVYDVFGLCRCSFGAFCPSLHCISHRAAYGLILYGICKKKLVLGLGCAFITQKHTIVDVVIHTEILFCNMSLLAITFCYF